VLASKQNRGIKIGVRMQRLSSFCMSGSAVFGGPVSCPSFSGCYIGIYFGFLYRVILGESNAIFYGPISHREFVRFLPN
jgi:hypothetical protein